ncbi:hypothetical protein CTI14_67465, partial [Methylobacterium radiotolerans]
TEEPGLHRLRAGDDIGRALKVTAKTRRNQRRHRRPVHGRGAASGLAAHVTEEPGLHRLRAGDDIGRALKVTAKTRRNQRRHR